MANVRRVLHRAEELIRAKLMTRSILLANLSTRILLLDSELD
jgi:hypothetical protein